MKNTNASNPYLELASSINDARHACAEFLNSTPADSEFLRKLVRASAGLTTILEVYFQEIDPINKKEKSNGKNNC